jgi:hypothetical protein
MDRQENVGCNDGAGYAEGLFVDGIGGRVFAFVPEDCILRGGK